MRVALIRPLLASLLAVTYLAITMVAFDVALAYCPDRDPLPRETHGHEHHGHHDHASDTNLAKCLKCCLGACLAAPGLSGPSSTRPKTAFTSIIVHYWSGSSVFAGQRSAPDPRPPRPLT